MLCCASVLVLSCVVMCCGWCAAGALCYPGGCPTTYKNTGMYDFVLWYLRMSCINSANAAPFCIEASSSVALVPKQLKCSRYMQTVLRSARATDEALDEGHTLKIVLNTPDLLFPELGRGLIGAVCKVVDLRISNHFEASWKRNTFFTFMRAYDPIKDFFSKIKSS